MHSVDELSFILLLPLNQPFDNWDYTYLGMYVYMCFVTFNTFSGANRAIASYNASGSVACFENKNFFFYFEKRSSLLQFYNSCKFKVVRFAPCSYNQTCLDLCFHNEMMRDWLHISMKVKNLPQIFFLFPVPFSRHYQFHRDGHTMYIPTTRRQGDQMGF
jgi:hypothetical protein